MSLAIWFWIIFVIAFLFFGFWSYRYRETFRPPDMVWWILMFLLGLKVFGGPISG
jgi:hypothetical protein